MKKIFTVLFATVIVSSAFAQYNPNQQRDYAYGNDRGYNMNDDKFKKDRDGDKFSNQNYFNLNERDMKIDQINREFDYKINSVKSRFFMGRWNKKRLIMTLEDQRQKEIQEVLACYPVERGHDNDHDLYSKHGW
jgi:hypothetical protein